MANKPGLLNNSNTNFAPVKPLQNAKTTIRSGRDNGSSLSAFLREIYQDVITRDESARREHLEVGRVIGNLIAGKLTMKRDPVGSGFVFVPRAGTSAATDRSNYPVFPQNSVTLRSKWLKAKIEVAARCTGSGYRASLQSSLYNLVVKNYFRDIFTNEYEQNEALSAQMFGNYVTRFFYNSAIEKASQVAPITQDKEVVLFDGFAMCKTPGCQHKGTPQDFQHDSEMYPRCPNCDGYNVSNMMDPIKGTASEVIGQRHIKQGDIEGELLDYPALTHDIRKLPHKSPFLVYRTRMPLRLCQSLFGGLDFAARSDASDIGFEIMNSLASLGGNIEGFGASDFSRYAAVGGEEAEMIEMWLEPEMYAGFQLGEEEEGVGGSIPANVPLEKIFPNGMAVVGFNDLRFIAGIYPEKPSVVSGVYFLQPFSGLGKGVSDAVDVARDLNELHSMAMAGLKRYGASGVFYDKSTLTLKDAKTLFMPNMATPVDLSKNPNIERIEQAIGQIQTNPVNPVLPQYAVQLNNLLNMAFLTGDFAQGMTQDVDIDTLGGQQLAHAKTEEQKGCILTMKGYHREQSGERITELFRKFIKIPMFFSSTQADAQAPVKGKMISSQDLSENVKFDAVPGSEQPINSFEQKTAARELVKEAGGLAAFAQTAQAFPKETAWYVRQFGITDAPLTDEHEQMVVCLGRVDNILELSKIIMDPEMILSQLEKPLLVREPGNILKAEFLAKILDDDEVLDWQPNARAAVELLIERHYEMEAEAQFRNESLKQQVGLKLQQEAATAALAAQAEQMEMQRGVAEEQQMNDLLMQAAQLEADEAAKDRDFERENIRDERNHNRALEIENTRQAKTELRSKPKHNARKAA